MIRALASLSVVLVASFGAAAVFHSGVDETRQPNAGNPQAAISTSVSECKVCHSGPAPGLRDYIEKYGSKSFVKLDESITWEQSDPHSVPFAELMSHDIGKKMFVKYPNALKNENCLTCHAVDTGRSENRFTGVDSNGIGCSACHGLSKQWQSKHYESESGQKVEWREWSIESKTAAGLKNLRDPMTKANLCASCHVGNPQQKKVITHEMYAAGHPPLPPFELLTFMDDQPRHWGTPFELEYFKSLDSSKQSLFSFKAEEGKAGYAARHFAAGAIAALRAEVSLHAFDAKSLPSHAGLDYARFDCYACHHDLKIDSDRQRRGFDGPPGRPPVKAWVGAVAGVVANHVSAERGAEFAKHWNELKIEMYSKPYGNPLTVGPKAQQLVDWCDLLAKEMEGSKSFGVDGAKTLHATLATEARKMAADPEAVMALVWAYRGMSKSLDRKDNLDELKPFLPLTLREKPFETGPSSKPVPKTVGQFTGERMKRFVNYQSAEFLKVFPR